MPLSTDSAPLYVHVILCASPSYKPFSFPTSMDIEFLRGKEFERQRAFLAALLPCLTRQEQIVSVCLAGSLAGSRADRWSSVDLLLLWNQADRRMDSGATPFEAVREALEEAFGEESFFCEQEGDDETEGNLSGVSLAVQAAGRLPREHSLAGVLFEIAWTMVADAGRLGGRSGPVRPLYVADDLTMDLPEILSKRAAQLGPPNVKKVEENLARFWLLLGRLPAVVGRQEGLAAHALVADIRMLLVDLVVALNGAERPQSRARINQYLGPAQLEAFENSMGLPQTVQRQEAIQGPNWVGQAVSLVVLYRWYAPQLVERHGIRYPQAAEDAVLALLRAELETWPAQISTG